MYLDFVGPLSLSNGYTYLLTCVDRFTRWPEAFLVADITAETAASMSVNGWISHVGVPSVATTDQGQQVESSLWRQLMKLLGTKRIRTTAYHPIANGLVQHFHCQLKSTLKAQPNIDNWADHLPVILLGIRMALKEDLHSTAAEFFASNSNDNLDPVSYVDKLKSTMQKLRARPHRQHSKRKAYVSKDLAPCTYIFVHHDGVPKPLQPPYSG